MSAEVVISGAGLWLPAHRITNDELVASYNAWVDRHNSDHAAEVAAGTLEAMPHSSAEFIEKASGIRSRYIYVKDGTLDVERMRPRIPHRGEGGAGPPLGPPSRRTRRLPGAAETTGRRRWPFLAPARRGPASSRHARPAA